jgi:AcrR family transcriptional regulator
MAVARPTGERARRRQLIDAAIWTFARKGYRAASVGDIVARARVARGTFYLYFDGKEAVFLAIINDFHDRLRRMLAEPESPVPLAEHNGRAMLRRSIRRWLGMFADHRDAATVILREAPAINPRFEAELARLRDLGLEHFAARFRRFQALGLVNRSVPPELLAHFQLGMVDEVVNSFILGGSTADLDELAHQVAAFEWNGIQPSLKSEV